MESIFPYVEEDDVVTSSNGFVLVFYTNFSLYFPI